MNLPSDARKYATATQRNREPILKVLLQVLPPDGTILEVASGTGEHSVYFAPRLQPRQWLPSEPDPQLRASIMAWSESHPADNLLPPINLDASTTEWNLDRGLNIKAIANINMIHISPWSACLGLMSGANRVLPPGGILYLYGPYKQHGEHTALSNQAFDEFLQSQNPQWGVRNLEDVVAVANYQQLALLNTYQMPANNLSVVFQRQ